VEEVKYIIITILWQI